MCLPVSFFERLFGEVCFKKELTNEKENHANNVADLNARINFLNSQLEDKESTVQSKDTELTLAKEKLRFHNELLTEHADLQQRYGALNARFRESVTKVIRGAKKEPDVKESSEDITRIPKGTIDKVLSLKLTSKRSFAQINKATKIDIDTIKEIIQVYGKEYKNK